MFYRPGSTSKASVQSQKKVQMSSQTAIKDSQVIQLKMKMKEVNDLCYQKEKELVDLKRTLKFTKIKEYEAELGLNVQESQRLRILLE